MRLRILAGLVSALATSLGAPAWADVLPEPPENAIPESCVPMAGVWIRDAAQGRNYRYWTILTISTGGASLDDFTQWEHGLTETSRLTAKIDCKTEGTVTSIVLTGENGQGKIEIAAAMTGPGTFTTTEMEGYDLPGAPPPDWKDTEVTVTWTRVLP
jgi:hypothetical protein